MKTQARTLTIALGLALAATACRGSGDDAGDDDDDAPDAAGGDDASIYDIQGLEIPTGTTVNLRGVVVTAIDNYGGRRGEFWVQEPAGGEYSGIIVRLAETSEVADLAVGDLVDIENAVIEEFAWSTDTSGRSTTQLSRPEGGAISVQVVGSGSVPTPPVVDALAIGQMTDAAARDAEWGKWDGVPFTVENVSITSGLYEIDEEDPTFVDFGVTGPLSVQASLAAPHDPVTPGDCLASVTGIGSYFFDFKIIPVATADITTGGSGCPAEESQAAECADSIDNDANGFVDCDDNHCSAVAECTSDTTVAMIQMGLVPVETNVSLSNLVVTAIDDIGTTNNPNSNKGFWAADAAQGAAHNGIYVYTDEAVPTGIVIGATLDLTGEVDEFDFCTPSPCTATGDTLTEIDGRNGSFAILVPVAVPLPLTGVTPNTLKAIDTGEPYEGVLVQLSNVEVTATAGGDRLTVTDANGQTIVVDDDSFNYAAADYAVGTCFATLTGVMSLAVLDDERRLMPRNGTDMVTVGGTCN